MKLKIKLIFISLVCAFIYLAYPKPVQEIKVEPTKEVLKEATKEIKQETKIKPKEEKKKPGQVSKEDSFEKNGYYTQILTNGEKINFSSIGVIYENGTRYTYYSSNVLYHYKTQEWHLGEDGIYRDDDGYIIVASVDHQQGQIVHTPFGKGIVRDGGCAHGTIDIYTAL